MMMDPILFGREERARMIHLWVSEHSGAVLSIHANIPGDNKNLNEAFLLVRFFESEIKKNYPLMDCERYINDDGPYTLCRIPDVPGDDLKKHMIALEDAHSLGRFVDLDVYDSQNHFSRTMYGIAPRTCYLCGNVAYHCIRSKKHETHDLIHFLTQEIKTYLADDMMTIAHHALLKELDLEDKFGLVTPTSKGSHDDMDYLLMLRAQKIILPYFRRFFLLGYEADMLYSLFDDARKIGIDAEKAMLEETQGINCYKGLIFVLGWLMVSTGYVLKHNQTLEHIFTNIHQMTHHLLDDFNQPPKTFGEQAYHAHHIMGARGEAYLGFPSIHHALHILDHHDINDQTLRLVLKTLILATDDTVMLKRSGSLEQYQRIKKMIQDLDPMDIDQVKSLTTWMIEKRLSFGGAADLLIGTLALFDIKQRYL